MDTKISKWRREAAEKKLRGEDDSDGSNTSIKRLNNPATVLPSYMRPMKTNSQTATPQTRSRRNSQTRKVKKTASNLSLSKGKKKEGNLSNRQIQINVDDDDSEKNNSQN